MSTFDLKTIKHQCDKARARIAEGHAKIESLQHLCPHPKDQVTEKPGSNTGGYDGPRFDRYWVDFDCGVCGKHWSEDR